MQSGQAVPGCAVGSPEAVRSGGAGTAMGQEETSREEHERAKRRGSLVRAAAVHFGTENESLAFGSVKDVGDRSGLFEYIKGSKSHTKVGLKSPGVRKSPLYQ